MPKKIVISKLGGPEVLEYQNYELSDKINDNEVRIKHTYCYWIKLYRYLS